MRAPTPSEPKSTFPTYQVPQVSAMRGSAPPVTVTTVVQVARTNRGIGADSSVVSTNVPHPQPLPPGGGGGPANGISVIDGSSCRIHSSFNNNNYQYDNSNIRTMLQSVNENYCLLNSVTVPKIQRINNDDDPAAAAEETTIADDHDAADTLEIHAETMITHNNNNNNDSDKLDCKFGALSLGRDIPYQKSDDLEVLDYDDVKTDEDYTLTLTTKSMLTLMKYALNNEKNHLTGTTVYCHQQLEQQHNDYASGKKRNNDQDYHVAAAAAYGDDDDAAMSRLPPLRLRGGGESSLSTGTSGWGTPPSQQASNNNANNTSGWGTANPANQNTAGTQQWNNNANRPPNTNQGPNQDANKANSNMNANGQLTPSSPANNTGGWGQAAAGGAASKSASQSSSNGPVQATAAATTSTGGATVPAATAVVVGGGAAKVPPVLAGAVPVAANNPIASGTTTKQQLEQLNVMREAIFSQDGWGGQHVNQDTHWDIPGSPEPPMKMDAQSSGGGGANAGSGGGNSGAPPPWKPAVNNGTELWETNLRNGGQPPPQPQQKTPWGHTPSTNIGGTWGEDDDTDSSNMWTGVPGGGSGGGGGAGMGGGQQQQQWGGAGGGNAGNIAPGSNANPMWGGAQKKESEWGGGGQNASSVVGGGGGGGGQPGWGESIRAANDPRAAAMDPRDLRPDLREMRGGGGGGLGGGGGADPMRLLDPREQMRMGGNGGDMRGDPRGITGRLNGAGADAFWTQAGGGPVQHLHHANKMAPGGPGNGGGGAGWEEPSPPTQRRNMPNYDDGTSLWGNPTGQQGGGGGGNANMLRNSVGGGGGPPGMAQSRIKPDGSVWCHGRNGSWDESGGGGIGGIGGGGGGGWEEPVPWNKPKMPGAPLWANDNIDNDWGHKQGPKPTLTKEMIWNSKGFRMLVDMGYKKEEVEAALRRSEMNFEDALDMLGSARNADSWRNRHDDHYEHQQFSGRGYPGGPPGQMPFPPGGNGPNLLNNMNAGGGGGPGNSLINNISPAVVQKMLTQGGGGGGGGGSQGYGGVSARANMQPQSQPSTQQLRMLVQQIQMAVQAGYLNHQILNQPLAPQTLILLNQLLQQIKTLQQLMNQQAMAQSQCGKPNNNALLQCSVLITKTKQQITNLQNQIAAQQAIYVKQQNHGLGGGGGGPDLFKGGMHDSINALQGNFADLALKEQNQPQSRLNQWINKDKEDGGEFSRAPGSVSKPLATSPNINPLGLTQPDGPWSSGRTGDGWPETGGAGGGDSANDIKDAQWSAPAQASLTDLVPEFEPGKPWKGNQIKSIEDDPSITPGSVVRSPLSIATIKDPELFTIGSNKSPPSGADASIQPLSLSSNTWSFNPPSSTTSAFTSFSPQSKLPSVNKVLDPNSAVTAAELWGAPKRGPPPGLSAKGSGGGGASLANGWASNLGGGGGASSWGGGGGAGQRSSGNWGGSPWLLLRNLTAQIDGSTLRTLCMQHGPLQSFHLYLHQGFALAKYSSREEATKAQTALNNCVLGNTTILAENPSEWDASALLQQVAASQQGASANVAWRSGGGAAVAKQPVGGNAGNAVGGGGGDTWSTGWSNNQSSASLWGSTALDSADGARATPSSLNSFLPGDLLGGESM